MKKISSTFNLADPVVVLFLEKKRYAKSTKGYRYIFIKIQILKYMGLIIK